MKELALTMLVLLLPSMSAMAKEGASSIKERVTQRVTEAGFAVRLKDKWVALFLLLQGDKTEEGQRIRFELFQKLKNSKLFKLWAHNPKKFMTWIVTGSMPIKYTDIRVRDEEYVQYFLIYKRFVLGRSLTQQEEQSARIEAMELLNEYAIAKGLRK